MNAPAPARTGKRRRALLILTAITLMTGIGWFAWYWLHARWHEATDDAYIEGHVVTISPETTGTVIAIDAEEGARVEAGQVLVELNPVDARIAYQAALGDLALTVRQVRGLYDRVDSGQADLSARQIALKQAREDVRRRENLIESGAISREELAHARDLLAAAEAALSSARGELSRNRALIDANDVARQPQVQTAAAQVSQAWLTLERMRIIAPISGYIARRSVQLGERVQPGSPLMTVVPLDDVWVEANFKETQLANMRLGQEVDVRADLYGRKVRYRGHIASLGMGTGSAFSLLPPQNASGNWIKIVQRVPVRIALDAAELAQHPLKLGLSMHVDVSLRDQSGPVLAAQARRDAPLLSTEAYRLKLENVDAVIAETIARNLPYGNDR